MRFVTISKNGKINNVVMRSTDPNNIYKKCGFKNNNNFSKHHSWEVNINNEKHILSIFGKDKGRALNENKYEMPPPIDKKLFFGDIAIICSNNNDYIEFTDTLWKDIYNKLMGGFEDIEYTDDEKEEFEEDLYDSDELTNDGYLKDGFVIEDNELTIEEYEDE